MGGYRDGKLRTLAVVLLLGCCVVGDALSKSAAILPARHRITRRLNTERHYPAERFEGSIRVESEEDVGGVLDDVEEKSGLFGRNGLVVKAPLGTEEVDLDADELTPRSASKPPIDHSRQRYWHCLYPDSPPRTGNSHNGPKPECRFPRRTAVRVKSMIERTWSPRLLGKLSEHNKHQPRFEETVSKSSSRRSKTPPTCENPRIRPKPLMNTGAPLKTIVFVALGGGRLCQAGTHDWRANLPKYIGKFTNAKVIIYGQTSHACYYCHNPEGKTEGCSKDLQQHGADAMFIVGSGRVYSAEQACRANELTNGNHWCEQQFTDLWQLLSNKWAQTARLLVHFPIRNMKRLMFNEIFDFDAIVDDGSFVKPSSPCAHEALAKCRNKRKDNILLYVARMNPAKGQIAFLEHVDPEMVAGYTIHFYGHGAPDQVQEVKDIARRKGLSIEVHGEVDKQEIFEGLCTGKGIIMYAEDKNPRAVYEGVTAGMPVFVAKEAQVADELVAQPFVTESYRRLQEGEERAAFKQRFDRDFSAFMEAVNQDSRSTIGKWVDTNLKDETVYLNLCKRLCLCKSNLPECTKQSYLARSRVKSKPRKTAANDPYVINMMEDALLKDSGRAEADEVWGMIEY